MLLTFWKKEEITPSNEKDFYINNFYNFDKKEKEKEGFTEETAFTWVRDKRDKIIDHKNFSQNFITKELNNKYMAFLFGVELKLYHQCLKNGKPFYSQMVYSADAHSSAYQIYSILTFDSSLSTITGIHPSTKKIEELYPGKKFYNLYNVFLDRVRSDINCQEITLELIKKLIMPTGYGITSLTQLKLIKAMTPNLDFEIQKNILGSVKKHSKELLEKPFVLFKFLKNLGFTCSALNLPVKMNFSEFLEFGQFYKKTETEVISVYLPKTKKRTTLNNRTSIDEGNTRKSSSATPANVIHHIDANIAMLCVEIFDKKTNDNLLFLNHDCLYTNIKHVNLLNSVYNEAIFKLINNNPSWIIKSIFKVNLKNIVNSKIKEQNIDINILIEQIENLSLTLEDILLKNFQQLKKKEIDFLMSFCTSYRDYLQLIPDIEDINHFCEYALR